MPRSSELASVARDSSDGGGLRLPDLPAELLVSVFAYLSPNDLLAVRCCCRALCDASAYDQRLTEYVSKRLELYRRAWQRYRAEQLLLWLAVSRVWDWVDGLMLISSAVMAALNADNVTDIPWSLAVLPVLFVGVRAATVPVAISAVVRRIELAKQPDCQRLFVAGRAATAWFSPLQARLTLVLADQTAVAVKSRLRSECRSIRGYGLPGTLFVWALFFYVRAGLGVEGFDWLVVFLPGVSHFLLMFMLAWADWRLYGAPPSRKSDVYCVQAVLGLVFFFTFILPLKLKSSNASSWFAIFIPLYIAQLIGWLAPPVLYFWVPHQSRIKELIATPWQLATGWFALTALCALLFAGEVLMSAYLHGMIDLPLVVPVILLCSVLLWNPLWTLLTSIVWQQAAPTEPEPSEA